MGLHGLFAEGLAAATRPRPPRARPRRPERSGARPQRKAAAAFLEVQAQRRPDTFNLSVDIPDGVLDRHVIPMSLLTVVENALKHNVATRNAPLDINVTAST
mgnify:CR=1 FL=1